MPSENARHVARKTFVKDKVNKIACTHSEDSNQSVYSLYASKKHGVASFLLSAHVRVYRLS